MECRINFTLSRCNFDSVRMIRYKHRMTDEKPYHHGDLRAALLAAAEAELAARGIEAFSLRAVAKRAGVSHAAPAHHFGDANGLLTALAAEGFRQFRAMQAAREAVAEKTPQAQMIAAGMGYVDFARARPSLFRLMHASDRPAYSDPDLSSVAREAYEHLCNGVAAVQPNPGVADVAAAWATAHGLADLMASGRLHSVASLPDSVRDAAIADIIARSLHGAQG
jgi:AcrR family transcriptional regulator